MGYSETLLDYDMYLYLHESINISRFQDERRMFVHTIDLAEGAGGDYSVINIFELLPMTLEEIENVTLIEDEYSFFKLVQIAMFRSNTIIVPDLAKWYYHFLVEVCIPDNTKICLENNYDGNYFREVLTKLYGDENELDGDFMFFVFPYNMKDDQSYAVRIGLRQSEHTKNLGTTMMKTQMRQNQLILTEFITIEEALSFARKKTKDGGFGGYCAMIGNDDCIMSVVNITHIRKLPEFQELIDEVSKYCPKEFWDAISKKMKTIASSDSSGDITSIFGAK